MSPIAAMCVLLFALAGSPGALGQTGLAGNPVRLFKAGNSKTTVLVFVRSDCPISNRYAPELRRLYDKYSALASFYLVYPDRSETGGTIQKHMDEYGYKLGVLRDPEHALVRLARARVAPEAAVFSARGKLLYHGRIDNRYVDFGKALAQPTRRDLEEALQSALAGKPIQVQSTRAIGCFLADLQ